MPDVVVGGGGPAGLGAALFTAKNDLATVVFDTDETWMHRAHLYNSLGIDEVGGTEFVETARNQAEAFGADVDVGEAVTAVERDGDGFTVRSDDGEDDARYVVFATGTDTDLAEELGCETTGEGLVDVSQSMETSVEDAYGTGATIRDQEWQAVISAGDGGAAALDILNKEEGEHFHDFDTPG